MLTPLYIRSPVGTRERLTDYIVERDMRTDGTKQLTVTVYLTQKNQHAFGLLQNQCVFGYLDEEYVIKQVTKNLPNQIQCTAISKFFEDLDSNFIYTTTSGDLSIQQMLDFCLAGTGYSYSVDTAGIAATFAANSFGNSDSLSLFQQVMTDFGTEFAVNGNQIIIAQQIARKTDNQFRYKMNLVSPTNTIDTSSLRTYIKGFGHQYEDGTYAAQIEYTSPLASVYGIKAANPVTDDNCFDNDTLMNEAKAALNDSIPISLSFNYTQVKKMGIQDIQLGDYCFVKIDPWGINASIRVVEIKDYADPNTPPVYTLGNILTRGTDTIIFANKTANNAVIIARSANSKADAAYASADGKSTIYRGQDQPTDPKVGDSWYVTDNDNYTIAIKSWNGLEWVTDIDINGVDQSVAQAQQDATDAINQANAAVAATGNIGTQIMQMQDDINIRVKENDVINQINVSTESILIAGQKVHITGQTTIDNAVITDAMIESVSATKLNVTQLSAIAADLGNVTAGNITGVNITGAHIDAGSIIIGDFNNYCANGDFEKDTVGQIAKYWQNAVVVANPTKTAGAGTYRNYSNNVVTIPSQASGNADRWMNTPLIPVSNGDSFVGEFDVKWGNTSQQGTVALLLHAFDANGNGLSWWPRLAESTLKQDWSHHSGTINMNGAPANTAYVQIGVSWQGSNNSGGNIYVDNILIRRALRGDLFVDGTITGVNITGSSFYQNANGYQTWLDSNGFHQHYNTSDVWIKNGYLQASDTYGDWTNVQPSDGVRVHGEDGNESHMSPTVVETSGTMYSQHGFVNTSRVELKTDITALDDNIGLSLINSLDVYKFKYKSQIESGQIKEIYGAIIGEDYNLPEEFIDYNRQGVNLYSSIFIAIKSIQELTGLHQQDVLKIAELESRISLLEGAA
jgi:phage minor structural protein